MRAVAGALVWVVAIGCGDDGSADPVDATPPAIDAAVTGPATVTIQDQGAPAPGLDVVWVDPDGAISLHDTTDAQGQSTLDVAAGSAVTVLAGGTFAISWLQIEPGDRLAYDLSPPASGFVGDASFTLAGPMDGATGYAVSLGMETITGADPVAANPMQITDGCVGATPGVVALATARDDAGALVGYAYDDVAVVEGGTTSATLGPWNDAPASVDIAFSHWPGNIVGDDFPMPTIELHLRRDGVPYRQPALTMIRPVGTSDLEATAGYPADFTEAMQFVAWFPFDVGRSNLLVAADPDPSDGITFDLQALFPPVVDPGATNVDQGIRFSWHGDGYLGDADGALFGVEFFRGDVEHTWLVMTKPDPLAPSTSTPPLPDELDAYRPPAGGALGAPTMIFVDADFVDGYDAFRASGWSVLSAPVLSDLLPSEGGVIRAFVVAP